MKPLKYGAFCDPKVYKRTQEVVLPSGSDPLGKVHRFLNLITFSVPFFKNYTTFGGMFEAPQTTTSEMDLEYFAFNRSCNPVQSPLVIRHFRVYRENNGFVLLSLLETLSNMQRLTPSSPTHAV